MNTVSLIKTGYVPSPLGQQIQLHLNRTPATQSWSPGVLSARALSLFIGVGTTACLLSPKAIDPNHFIAFQHDETDLSTHVQHLSTNEVVMDVAVKSKEVAQTAPELVPVAPSVLADLGWLREHGNISMTALAGVLGVTRKSLYDWLSGSSAPRDQRVRRIAAVRVLFAGLPDKSSGPAVLKSLDRQLSDGTTLREILRAETDSDAQIESRVQYALHELALDIADKQKRLSRPARGGAAESEIRSI